jgi:heptosyltransferase II
MIAKESYRSFLVINTFGVGDVLFSTPLLRNLRNNFPKARIYYVCNKKTSSLLRAHPLIEKVFVYERDDFVKAQKRSFWAGLGKYLEFISDIRRERIDCAIDLSLNTPFGLFALLAGIKKRYGLDFKNRSRFLNRKVKIHGFVDKHVADYYLDTLNLLGIRPSRCDLEVYADAASREWADNVFRNNRISKEDIVIGICPCGGAAFGKDNYLRRWPPERFAQVIDRLVDEYKAKIMIFAGPDEKSDVTGIIAQIRNKNNVIEFCDATLEQTVPLIEHCTLFISNDTGFLRYADALNRKIVALYGPINEKVYGPYRFNDAKTVILTNDLPCRPCYNTFRITPCEHDKACLKTITVDQVIVAVKKLLTE